MSLLELENILMNYYKVLVSYNINDSEMGFDNNYSIHRFYRNYAISNCNKV